MDKTLHKRLETALNKRKPGEFHFSEIYGAGWTRLYIGDRVKLGNEFLRRVRQGYFTGIEDTGVKKGGGRVYRKTG